MFDPDADGDALGEKPNGEALAKWTKKGRPLDVNTWQMAWDRYGFCFLFYLFCWLLLAYARLYAQVRLSGGHGQND